MRLVRYNPFSETPFFRNTPDDFFKDSFFQTNKNENFYPPVDIMSEGESVVLSVELPGVKKEDISIQIEDKVLTVQGERKFEKEDKKELFFRRERSYGSFERSFKLSDDVLTEEVNADFKDGILTVILKKDNAKEAVKQITIN